MKEQKLKEMKKQIKDRERKIEQYKMEVERLISWIKQEEYAVKFEKEVIEKIKSGQVEL
jgi:hypothetical protein